jgi:hypothetical protein
MARLSPISALWFWRGLSGHSITFASLFASVLLGFSISRKLHHFLSSLGFHWIYVILLPILIFKMMAKAEATWIPDPRRRRSIALGILVGSMALSWAISYLHSRPDPIRPTRLDAPTPWQGKDRGVHQFTKGLDGSTVPADICALAASAASWGHFFLSGPTPSSFVIRQ